MCCFSFVFSFDVVFVAFLFAQIKFLNVLKPHTANKSSNRCEKEIKWNKKLIY